MKIMNWLLRLVSACSFQPAAFHRRTPAALTEAERKHRVLAQRLALAGVPDSHPVWRTVLELVDEHERNMMARALEEKLTSEERHYNAGLAASAEYLANALRDFKAAAEIESRKRKTEE
jgi:hypothetical protein